ncbi:MAG: hypothetical protein Ct9H300mP24_7480 [Candidatus Neomarinimicrobiota bacterium]|nr:MAG: hypothetical protein Ct9H300mP24_7480 [Candidatus Neomarinimicrobiota bacterium]
MQTSETFIATAQEKVNTLKDRLTDGSISTNKEYDAMMDSIDYEKNLVVRKKLNFLIKGKPKEHYPRKSKKIKLI